MLLVKSRIEEATEVIEQSSESKLIFKPVVANRFVKLYVGLRLKIMRVIWIWQYFGHPFKIIDAVRKLEELKTKFWGEPKHKKLIKGDKNYFFAMNGPGVFSKSFKPYFLSELNRIYHKYPRTGLRVVQLAITKKCNYSCEHCFEWDNLRSKDILSDESIINIITKFQERGVGQVQLGGGEPLLRYQTILKILEECSNASDFNIVTSGYQLTQERAIELKSNGLTSITISLDHYQPDLHNKFRGHDEAYAWAMKAITNAKNANLVVNLSLCATKEFVSSHNLERYAELAFKLGISFIWIVEPSAVGRYKNSNVSLSKEQIGILEDFYHKTTTDLSYMHYPGIAYPSFLKRRVGCFGRGDRYLYIDTNGEMKACPMCDNYYGSAEKEDIDETLNKMSRTKCPIFENAQF